MEGSIGSESILLVPNLPCFISIPLECFTTYILLVIKFIKILREKMIRKIIDVGNGVG